MWSSSLTLAMNFTLNFQGQIWNLLYLSQKRFMGYSAIVYPIEFISTFRCLYWGDALELGMSRGVHCWDNYPGTLLCCQVCVTHLKIGHPHYVAGPPSWWSLWAGSASGVVTGGPHRILDKDSIVLEAPFSGPFKRPAWLGAVSRNVDWNVLVPTLQMSCCNLT